ncbi:class E sortase [Streptomyces flavofungini]|uniref:class E sortase n=1 Tax=Streptomyces flavofungini TaxID=68200 RepID=UPI0025AF7ECA|nr:class E sortase [Streptomyces flavofungini]WJV51423.1 class E sortase [Streptomyces flavofungini]
MVVHGQGSARRHPLARLLWYAAEATLTLGLVLLLLVVHQLWWTNRQARAAAESKVDSLERGWGAGVGQGEGQGGGEGGGPGGSRELGGGGVGDRGDQGAPGGDPGAPPARNGPARGAPAGPAPDRAYAVLRIPRLGLRVPVAAGVSKGGVLNKGYVGHYPRTAQPGRPGNFALAGHRNTHGEPFRHLDRLRPGDRMTVGTRDAVFTYTVDKTLDRTSPRDGGVIAPVPRSAVRPGQGYDRAGYYVTLTTCTPVYTSKYRLVVWGKLTAVRPR